MPRPKLCGCKKTRCDQAGNRSDAYIPLGHERSVRCAGAAPVHECVVRRAAQYERGTAPASLKPSTIVEEFSAVRFSSRGPDLTTRCEVLHVGSWDLHRPDISAHCTFYTTPLFFLWICPWSSNVKCSRPFPKSFPSHPHWPRSS
jgi:hypothetical protein